MTAQCNSALSVVRPYYLSTFKFAVYCDDSYNKTSREINELTLKFKLYSIR